jgi:hypothetical protein
MSRAADRVRTRRLGADILPRLMWDAAGMPEGAADVVRERLKIAARVVERTAGRPGPAGYGSAWPSIRHEFADLVGREPEPTRLRLQPTARMLTQADTRLHGAAMSPAGSWRCSTSGSGVRPSAGPGSAPPLMPASRERPRNGFCSGHSSISRLV